MLEGSVFQLDWEWHVEEELEGVVGEDVLEVGEEAVLEGEGEALFGEEQEPL